MSYFEEMVRDILEDEANSESVESMCCKAEEMKELIDGIVDEIEDEVRDGVPYACKRIDVKRYIVRKGE